MNVTLGVPRIKEIINAARKISTPIIKAELANPHDAMEARTVKGRLERTELGQVCTSIREVLDPTECYVYVELDAKRISDLQLSITADSAREAILNQPKLKIEPVDILVVGDYALKVCVPTATRERNALFELHRAECADHEAALRAWQRR